MLTRRKFLPALAAVAAAVTSGTLPRTARAQSAEQAAAFVGQTAKKLMAVVNGPTSGIEKAQQLQQIVDQDVDVDAVARFCLGRYWRSATPEQQQQYLRLFHEVLLRNITSKIGDYTGVTITIGRTIPREGGFGVASVVDRPGQAPANVEWIVSTESGSPRIVDVVAEGTSLRLTQRSDYASYLAHNNNSVQGLLDAMRQQLTRSG